VDELTDATAMIDTHCHLENEAFHEDLDAVITAAQKLGIGIITSAIESHHWERNCNIAETYENVFATTGLDPVRYIDCDLASTWIQKNKERMISIGEIGLDHFYIRDHHQRELQESCFKRLIDLAHELCLPIQVHSRSAGKKALEILESCNASDVHMHAFDGKASLARRASTDLGYYFSIPTSVVRSPQKQKLVKAIDIERLLLETDSPVLGPEKQSRNVPSNLPIALKETASIMKRSEEEIREIALENTLRLYSRIKIR
jgi:TatD DNase family protein